MPQTAGLNLISRLLIDGRLADFYRLRREYFYDQEQAIYDALKRHVDTHGDLPSLAFFQRHNEIAEPDSSEPYGVWYDEYTHRALHNRFLELIPQLQRDIANTQSRDALTRLTRFVEETHTIQADSSRDLTNIVEVGRDVVAEYERLRSLRGISGIPSNWPTLDRTTHGFQRGDLIIFAARPGVGKSTIAVKLALEAHRLGAIPLLVSMEMNRVQLGGRIMTMAEGLNLKSIRSGELTTYGEYRLREAITRFEQQHPFYFVEGQFRQDVSQLSALVYSLRPDILIIDGAYLLKLPGAPSSMPLWQRTGEIAKNLKSIASTAAIPTIGTYQINREGGRRDRAGHDSGIEHLQLSDELGQLASLVVGVFSDEDTDTIGVDRQRRLKILKGREGETGQWFIHWDYERMNFNEIAQAGGDPYHRDEPEMDLFSE